MRKKNKILKLLLCVIFRRFTSWNKSVINFMGYQICGSPTLMKLMTTNLISYEVMTTNLISYEVDDQQIWYLMKLMTHKFDILWSNDYKFDTRWSWWPTNLISYEVDDPQIWYPMKLVTFGIFKVFFFLGQVSNPIYFQSVLFKRKLKHNIKQPCLLSFILWCFFYLFTGKKFWMFSNRGELGFSGRVGSSCSNGGTHRVTVVVQKFTAIYNLNKLLF
jgi:hypothetical protein